MSIKVQKDCIRQRAEELLAQQDELEVTTLAEARALIKELRIREIESELRHTASTSVVLPEQQVDEGSVESGGCMVLQLLSDGTLATGTIVTESTTGYGATELIGHPIQAFVKLETIREVFHPKDRDVVEGLMRTSLNTQEPVRGEFRVICQDGRVRHVESAGVTVFDETGEPLHVIGSIIDVTQRVEKPE